jgi:hypothetical protein
MKNIIVMPNYSNKGDMKSIDFIENCKYAWKNWCNNNDCEFLELTQSIADFKDIPPQMQKMWTLDILIHNDIKFNQVAQVDYDTFPMPNCPNFFNYTNDNFAAVLDNGFGPSINRSIQMVKNNWYHEIDVNWDNYFNSGFIIYNINHREVFHAVQTFYEENLQDWKDKNRSSDLTDDQTLLNFELRKQLFDIEILPRSYNVLDWHCKNFFSNYTDELGREINAITSIRDCINIFHLTGDTQFRNLTSNFLIENFYNKP